MQLLLSRRGVLAATGVLGLGLAAGVPRLDGLLPGRDGFAVLEDLTRADFEAAVGSTLQLVAGDGSGASGTVQRVVDTGSDRDRQFAVHLAVPAGLRQDLYEVRSDALGAFPLMLVPVAQGLLEAVVDRTSA